MEKDIRLKNGSSIRTNKSAKGKLQSMTAHCEMDGIDLTEEMQRLEGTLTKQNPKMAGSNLIDCVPQHGPCPNDCNQCYYNKWFYAGHEPVIPTQEEADGKIVRVNSGHDSNLQKELVLDTTRDFRHRFYNTSIPNLDFENAPVVVTVNPREDDDWIATSLQDNLMYVRFKANTWNMEMGKAVIRHYTGMGVPVVLTFMRYYELQAIDPINRSTLHTRWYDWNHHVMHDYWAINEWGWYYVMGEHDFCNPLVFTCGTPQSPYCRDCGVCETLYWRLLVIEGRDEEILHGIANVREGEQD